MNLIIFVGFIVNVLSINLNSRNFSMEGQLKKQLKVHVNSQDLKWILYKIPVKKINFLRIKFESKLKANQIVLIKSKSDQSEFELENKHGMPNVKIERRICSKSQSKQDHEIVPLGITTESTEHIYINVTAFIVEIYAINIGKNRSITIDHNYPIYGLLKFNNTNVNMEMRIESEDDQCMSAFIEQAECSLNNLSRQPVNTHITRISKKGSIPIRNYYKYRNSSLFVVFFLSENNDCKKNSINQNISIRNKTFTVTFVDIDIHYKMHIVGLFWILVSFAVIYLGFYYIYLKCWEFNPKNKGQCNLLENINEEKNIEKDSKDSQCFCVNYNINPKYLFGISVFYGLPVMELFWHFLKVINEHKYLNQCNFNDHCNKPWESINSINNVMSNMGFVIMGITFIIVVTINRYFMNKNSFNSPNYGIFYALGVSLIMQGISSACFHICPRSDTVQFDASFTISFGCLLTLYFGIQFLQELTEHEINIDEKIKQYFAFISTVRLLMTALMSIEDKISALIQWILIGTFQLPIISISIYKIFNSPDVRWLNISNRRKMYSFAILFINILVGSFSYQGNLFLYFTILMITNCCVLMTFYYLNTIINTRITIYDILNNKFIFLTFIGSIIYGSFAIKFILLAPSNWQLISNESRISDQACIWGSFYDYHDMWHIFSSITIFLCFMWIFLIDGKILQRKRRELEPQFNNAYENPIWN